MAAALLDPITGKLLDKALDKAFTEVGGVVQIILSSKTSGKELKEQVSWLKPTIDQIIKVDVSADSDTSPDIIKQYKKFQADLKEGLDLVERLLKLRSFDFFKKYRYGKKVLNLRKKLYDFIIFHGPPDVILAGKKLDADLRVYFERLIGIVNAGMTNDPNSNTVMLQQIDVTQVFQTPNQVFQNLSDHGMHEATAAQQSVSCTYRVPKMPTEYVVGLNNSVHAVKKILLQNDVNIVGVTGMGGSGKTTLALALCNDTSVKDFFKKNIIFITVSTFLNENGLLEILGYMWDEMTGDHRSHFQSIQEARFQLQTNLSSRTNHPTLVVLDDVWSRSYLENLLFEAKGYKTIFTTRDESTFPIRNSTCRQYKMPMLENANALSLFCFWAFGQPSIPTTQEEDLVKQVAAECHGLPLALKVIGSCLRNEPRSSWESARKKLSRAESPCPYYNDEVLKRLKMSIDFLDDETKQCFLDLGAFPEGRKFSVNPLLDIWVYVRGMDWDDAFVVLLELAKRNLLNLTSNPGSRAIEFSCASEFCFSQHHIMRELALHLASKESIIQRERLFMPCKEKNIPKEWQTLKNQSSGAQFLSIHTGAMAERDWLQIDFRNVEALALFFSASEYCLPTFLHTMPNLKVVFIYNYGSKRAILQGLPCFSSFTQIKSVLLERLIVSPLYDGCKSWESLENLYVCLCEGLGNMTLLDIEQVSAKLPMIIEINIDHCSDLEELPGKICNLTSLQRLSVTNCHLIQKLPNDLRRLQSLKLLRVSACTSLSTLPLSICKLQQLEFLDISLCRSLKDLPMEFDQLSKLKELDIRECSGLKKLPKSLAKLRSLRRVICDENTERQWRSIKTSAMPNLTIDSVEETFSLDWLDD